MTLGDARRAYGEMVDALDPKHAAEVKAMLDDAAKRQKDGEKKSP